MKKLRVSDAVFTCGFSLVVLLALANTLALTFRSADIIVVTVVLTLAFALMARFKWLAIVLVSAAVIFLIVVWRSALTASFVDFLGSFFQWIWGLIEVGYDDPSSAYMLFAMALICLSITFPFFLLVRHNANVLLLLLVGVAVFFGQQLMGFELINSYFWAFLLLVILYAARQAMPRDGKSELMLLMSAPLCLALLAVTLNMPVSDEPAGTQVVAAVSSVFSRLPEWLSFDWGPFNVSTGNTIVDYGDVSGDLGGEVILSDATVLFVKGDRPVYLKGRSYTTFTGRRWEADSQRTTDLYSFESPFRERQDYFLLDMYSAVYDYNRFPYETGQFPIMAFISLPDLEAPKDSYLAESMSIHYWDISTNKVFSPYFSMDYRVADEFAGDVELYKQANSDILTDEPLEKDFSYTAEVIRPSLESNELAELYRECRPGYWHSLGNDPGSYKYAGDHWDEKALYLFMMLDEYSTRVAGQYTQLPETTTDRVRELSEHITSGLDNNYDRAAAIESFLRTNYTYNTSPPELPQEADFVDHFLFVGREGYCTYFATAMAVLCRSAGIPARYVEGYAPSELKNEDFYVVTGQQAHAWTEVYLEGAGWIPFEPTSAYPSDGIRVRQDATPSAAPSAYPVPSGDIFTDPVDEVPLPSDVQPPRETSAPVFVWPVIAAALILLIAVQIIRRRIFLRRAQSGDFSADGVIRLYGYFLRALFLMKMRPGDWETAMEFGERADQRYSLPGGPMLSSARVFCKVRYGALEPDAVDRTAMLAALGAIDGLIKRELGWRVVFLRYVAGVI